MKIKRIVSVAATFVMALGLFTGCGAASTDTTTTTANNNTTAVQDTVKSTAASDSTTAQTTPSSGKKTLIVYYSASGSTKAVAQNIAESADADIFLTQVMTLTGLIITVVFLRNIMMRVLGM